jgi:hypothetical protein
MERARAKGIAERLPRAVVAEGEEDVTAFVDAMAHETSFTRLPELLLGFSILARLLRLLASISVKWTSSFYAKNVHSQP